MTENHQDQSENKKNYQRLVMEGPKFRVIIDNSGDIDWYTDHGYGWEELSEAYLKQFNLVINKVAELETMCGRSSDPIRFKRLSAEAIARALDRDLSAADEMLIAVDRMLREDLRDQCRTRYLVASVCFTTPFFMLMLQYLNDWFSEKAAVGFWILFASSFGAMGALLSVIVGSSQPKNSPTATDGLQVLEAGARILGGAIAGSLIAVAIKSGWILQPLSQDASLNKTAIMGAFAAGYLERLAPSLINKLEQRAQSSLSTEPATSDARKPGARRAGNAASTPRPTVEKSKPGEEE
jgi:hypothetical protein